MWTTALRNVLMKSSVPAVLWKRMLTLSRNRPSKQLMGQLEELRLLSCINKGKSARIAIVFQAFSSCGKYMLMSFCTYDQGWKQNSSWAKPLWSPQSLQQVFLTNFPHDCMHWSHASSAVVTLSHHSYAIIARGVTNVPVCWFWNFERFIGITASGFTASWTCCARAPATFVVTIVNCVKNIGCVFFFLSCIIVNLATSILCQPVWKENGRTCRGGSAAKHLISRATVNTTRHRPFRATVLGTIVGQISVTQLVIFFFILIWTNRVQLYVIRHLLLKKLRQ